MKAIVRSTLTAATTASLCLGAGPVFATTISGTYEGFSWIAQSLLTGVTSTGNSSDPAGDSIYHPIYPAYNGVVSLIMNYGAEGSYGCSGSLLSDRRSILTAAHCVSHGAGSANPLSTMVLFQPDGGLAADTRIQTSTVPAAGVSVVAVSDYFVHSEYSGRVIDQNDIAVLRLSDVAPAWTTSYGLYTAPDLAGKDFVVTGYGRLGDGATGTNDLSARLRTGENTYDYRLGDDIFGDQWANVLGYPGTQIEHSWVADFDSGLTQNDSNCLIAMASNMAGAAGSIFCDTGLGAREAAHAPGDSGGAGFVDGLIASVNSYGLTFWSQWGDVDNSLNASFGELTGYVPVYLHSNWIQSQMYNTVPEPDSSALVLLGLMGLSCFMRRRHPIQHDQRTRGELTSHRIQ